MATTASKQISFPAGLVMHMERWVDGYPGHNLPSEAMPQRTLEMLYPADMVRDGYVYIRAESASSLNVGDAIQIDRTHATIARIGKPKQVYDAGREETVLACRVSLSSDRTYI